MERTKMAAYRWRLILFFAVVLASFVLLWDVICAIGMQVLAAALFMLLALPICRQMEKRVSGSIAAILALVILLCGTAAAVLLLVPRAVQQVQTLGTILPPLMETLQAYLMRMIEWMENRGLNLTPIRDGLMSQLSGAAGGLVTRAVSLASTIIGSIGQVLLSPLLAFYLLRDRRKIASGLTLLLPVALRARGVRAAREMRRESAAYLRGQLLLSLIVGGMTAVGLLLTGTPGWLILGMLMGLMELIPYIGPVIAGIPAVLLSLQGGWVRALWTLAVIVIVQETEGAVLSPRLVGGATALHPMAVLLLVSAGGMLGGTLGMVLVIPAVVSIRGAVRGWRE